MEENSHSTGRPLSQVERIIWRLSEAAPMNVTMVARVRGPLSETRLSASLRVLQQQYELLQVRVERDGDFLGFRSDQVPEIPLRSISAESDSWVGLAEREINDPISSQRGPLARCVHVRHAEDEHHLLLTFHHVVGDGMSGVYLVRDLLDAVAQRDTKATNHAIPKGIPVAMDQRLPAYTRGSRGWGSGLRFQAASSWSDFRFGKPQRTRLDVSQPPYERRIRILPREYAASLSQQLLERARQENTTVHAALAAAMCLSVAEDLSKDHPVSMKFRTPVNVRGVLTPPVGEDLGLFASMVFFRQRVASTDEYWPLARKIRTQIKGQVDRGVPCMLVRLMPVLYRLMRADQLSDAEFSHRWYEATPSTCGITNIGRLDVPTEYGDLQLQALHFAVALSSLGDFSCTVSSLAGRLHCNFLCPEPVLSDSHAEALVERIESRLLRAIA